MATHSSVPAWRIPEMGEPGGLPSMGSHRVGHDWSDLAAAAADSISERMASTWFETWGFLKCILFIAKNLLDHWVIFLMAKKYLPLATVLGLGMVIHCVCGSLVHLAISWRMPKCWNLGSQKKHSPCLKGFAVYRLGYYRKVEKAMAPHSSTFAWKIPWMEEPGRLQSMGSLRVGYDWETSLSLFTFVHWRRKWQPTPVFLPGESQGRGSLVACRVWGRTESNTTEAT